MASPDIDPKEIFDDNLDDLFDQAGLTKRRLVEELAGKLRAKSEKVFYDGKSGDVIYSCKLEAHDIQIRALEMAFKLRGLFVSKVEHTGAGGGPIQIRGEMNVEALRNAIKRSKKAD